MSAADAVELAVAGESAARMLEALADALSSSSGAALTVTFERDDQTGKVGGLYRAKLELHAALDIQVDLVGVVHAADPVAYLRESLKPVVTAFQGRIQNASAAAALAFDQELTRP